MSRDFKEDVSIDRFNLDTEAERQPSLCYAYNEMLADVERDLNRLSDQLGLMSAKMDLNIRQNPPEGIKITESTILSLVTQDDGIIKKKEEIVDKKREVAVLWAAVKAINHRESELDNLVKLYLSGYYADPNRSRADEGSDDVRGHLNRKGD